jgi:hypothetical protein
VDVWLTAQLPLAAAVAMTVRLVHRVGDTDTAGGVVNLDCAAAAVAAVHVGQRGWTTWRWRAVPVPTPALLAWHLVLAVPADCAGCTVRVGACRVRE